MDTLQSAQSSFAGVGGLGIFTRSWRPVSEAPRAVVVISHGFSAHSGQYDWAARQLAAVGLAVHALDHRGRGRSDGERFYVEKHTDYVSDLKTFIDAVKLQDPGLPVFLLGHSAGGVLACVYALEHQSSIDGLICESFAFRLPAPALALNVIKGLSRIAPRARVLRLKLDHFSRDPVVVEELKRDPLIADEVQPTNTVAEMVSADERLEREFQRIVLPVLIMHGTADRVTLPGGSQIFYDKVGSRDRTLKLYDGHYHDLLADFGREQVIADIQAWIGVRIALPATRVAAYA